MSTRSTPISLCASASPIIDRTLIRTYWFPVKTFKILTGFMVRFTFTDGTSRTIDLGPHLDGPIFRPLRRRDYFRMAFLDHGVISWPNGADIAPEFLHDNVRVTA